MKSKLINRVIGVIKDDIEHNIESLEELLSFVPIVNLIQYLNEDEWDNYSELNKGE